MLELEGLTRRYGDRTVLDGLSFGVERGQMLGFVGPNGAGKTTTMRIVLGVLEPNAGEVRFEGRPIDFAARSRFGYMPEERGLYPKMRVRDQLAYLAELHGLSRTDATAAADRWMERMGIAERADSRIEELSLGNQQRVQLAAALVHDPDLLVLDEPFSGLDPIGVEVMAEVLRERARDGVPVVFSSHQLALVEDLCDAIAIIKDGRLVVHGTVDGLRAQGGAGLWQVRVEGAAPGWADAVPGATVEGERDGALHVRIDGDEQPLLDHARRAGRVVRFGPVQPTLTDLFREAVGA